MKIVKANARQINESLKIAKELKSWFTKEAINNMKPDFLVNKIAVATENNKVLGFLCYSSFNGFLQIKWMGIKKEFRHRGIGTSLLKFAERKAKSLGLHKIEADTLTDKDKYGPYITTRNFYYKNNFKKIGEIKVKGWNDQIILSKEVCK